MIGGLARIIVVGTVPRPDHDPAIGIIEDEIVGDGETEGCMPEVNAPAGSAVDDVVHDATTFM